MDTKTWLDAEESNKWDCYDRQADIDSLERENDSLERENVNVHAKNQKLTKTLKILLKECEEQGVLTSVLLKYDLPMSSVELKKLID